MGKRSNFERVERDYYPTPKEAVLPLLPFLERGTKFCEPCFGDGALIRSLEAHGHFCVEHYDIAAQGYHQGDATIDDYIGTADNFITNPPWSREVLHPIILNLSRQLPTWLLFDADWMHTRQSAPYLPLLRKIVSVGRVKWIPDSKMTGKDNCAWHLFDANASGPIEFVGRT